MEPGTLVADKYRIEGPLGRGGMATVFRATHEGLGQLVAVKIMTPTDAHGAVERFRREAQILARLRGEHVARAIDFGTLPTGELYLVLEHLEGDDLARVLGNGPLPLETAVAYTLQVCEGLAEAHAAGLVHRDIKPANLFVTTRPDGSPLVKVLDFGIAKPAEAKSIGRPGDEITATGTIIATVNYASPEQLVATKYVGPATDQFSLGAAFYEMLTAERAFPGDVGPAMNAVLTGRIPDLRQKLPAIPAGVPEILTRALGKRPQDRFTSIAELARALAPYGPKDHAIHAERATRLLGETPAASSTSVPVTAMMAIPRRSTPPGPAPLEASGPNAAPPISVSPPISGQDRASIPYSSPPSTSSPTSSANAGPKPEQPSRTSGLLSLPYVVGVAIVVILGMALLRRVTRHDPATDPSVAVALPPAVAPPNPTFEADPIVPDHPFPPPGTDASPSIVSTPQTRLPDWCAQPNARKNKRFATDCKPPSPLEAAIKFGDWTTVKGILLPRMASLSCAELSTLKEACRATGDACARAAGQQRVDKGCR